MSAVFADEFFTDVYFDTPSFTLLKMKSAVRHRSREIPGQPQNRKDGRQLMQIKLNMPGEELTRTEVKFPIKYYEVESQEDKHAVLGIIDRDHRADFSERVRAVGIDPWSLREALTLIQRRRRVYLSDSIGALRDGDGRRDIVQEILAGVEIHGSRARAERDSLQRSRFRRARIHAARH